MPDLTVMNAGEMLRTARERRSMGVVSTANRADVAATVVQSIEQDVYSPEIAPVTLYALADAVGMGEPDQPELRHMFVASFLSSVLMATLDSAMESMGFLEQSKRRPLLSHFLHRIADQLAAGD